MILVFLVISWHYTGNTTWLSPALHTSSYSLKVMVSTGAVVALGVQAAILEFAARIAWTEIISAEFFGQFFFSVNDSYSTFHAGFRRKTFPAFTGTPFSSDQAFSHFSHSQL